MKKITALLVVTAILLGLFCGCSAEQTNSEKTSQNNATALTEVVYPKIYTNFLLYYLTDEGVNMLQDAVDQCKKVFNTADPNKEEELSNNLYKAMNLLVEIRTQLDVARLKYNCDYSNKRAKSNYNKAVKLESKATDIFWEFLNYSSKEDNPLSQTVSAFEETNFPSVIYSTETYDEHKTELENITAEFNSVKNSASDEELLSLFCKYIDTANSLANSAYCRTYYDYAMRYVYNRDYIEAELEPMRQYVKEYLVPLYYALEEKSNTADEELSAYEYTTSLLYDKQDYNKFDTDLLGNYIKSLGDKGDNGMDTAFSKGRMIISNKDNANKVSYSTVIGNTPLCYFHKSDLTLKSLTHILGIYYAYANGIDTNASSDLKQTYAFTNSLLFLSYTSGELNSPAFEAHEIYTVSAILYEAISSAIHDEFFQLILTEDTSTLTVERIGEILNNLMVEYGTEDFGDTFKNQILTYWKRHGLNYVGNHSSFVTGSVVALEIYQKSLVNYSVGVEHFNTLIESDVSAGIFVDAITASGLYSPFDEETYKQIYMLKEHLVEKNTAF